MQVKARLFKMEPFLMVRYKIIKDFWVSRLTISLLCAHGNVHFDNQHVMLEIYLLGQGRDFIKEQQKEPYLTCPLFFCAFVTCSSSLLLFFLPSLLVGMWKGEITDLSRLCSALNGVDDTWY